MTYIYRLLTRVLGIVSELLEGRKADEKEREEEERRRRRELIQR